MKAAAQQAQRIETCASACWPEAPLPATASAWTAHAFTWLVVGIADLQAPAVQELNADGAACNNMYIWTEYAAVGGGQAYTVTQRTAERHSCVACWKLLVAGVLASLGPAMAL